MYDYLCTWLLTLPNNNIIDRVFVFGDPQLSDGK